MSVIPCVREEHFSPGFTDDINRLLNGIYDRIDFIGITGDDFRTKTALREARGLEAARSLFQKALENPETMSLLQKILDSLEKYLDNVNDEDVRSSLEYSELLGIYLEMSQLICNIRISEAEAALRQEKRNAT